MGHYAKVNAVNIVEDVIVADAAFVEAHPEEGYRFIKTSYNTRRGMHWDQETNAVDDGVAIRGNYAGVGYTYDEENDVFIEPQPYPSWTLHESEFIWYPPTEQPEDHVYPDGGRGQYHWNEDAYNNDGDGWVLTQY